jgi:hypothetical protein
LNAQLGRETVEADKIEPSDPHEPLGLQRHRAAEHAQL